MIRRLWAPALLVAGVGCAAGPSYHPETPVPPATKVGAARSSDSVAAFFDSLSAARAHDTAAAGVLPPVPPRSLAPDSLAGLAWLDLFRDSTMIGLVRTALGQNRDLQTAVARIREFRADVGVARAPLFPEVSANGSASKNQVAIGSFPPASYDAYRLTGDVAWELDFWGKTRRGIEAARADLASEEAARRAVVLSLVSDVATGYLSLLELDQERSIAEVYEQTARDYAEVAAGGERLRAEALAALVERAESDLGGGRLQIPVNTLAVARPRGTRLTQGYRREPFRGDARGPLEREPRSELERAYLRTWACCLQEAQPLQRTLMLLPEPRCRSILANVLMKGNLRETPALCVIYQRLPRSPRSPPRPPPPPCPPRPPPPPLPWPPRPPP